MSYWEEMADMWRDLRVMLSGVLIICLAGFGVIIVIAAIIGSGPSMEDQAVERGYGYYELQVIDGNSYKVFRWNTEKKNETKRP